ncbi:MAG: ATP-binding cassette domain-containing protein [Desulfovibrio sp.]|nr:ATP-binding cassette domain-containing protein [Desulfovibrio sp.]
MRIKMPPVYSIKNLVKSIPGAKKYRILVRSLTIRPGDKIAITGPSGCGKSTTLDMLGLSLKPDSAERFIFEGGEKTYSIADLWTSGDLDALAALRRDYLGYVLQSGELIPYLTAAENMTLTARLAGCPGADAEAKARELAEKLGIADQWSSMPATLSVGQRQRSAIVRALCPGPPVILADEPTAALDPGSAASVMNAMLEAIETYGAALVLVTHNESWAKAGDLRPLPFRIVEGEEGATALLDDGSEDESVS